MHTNNSETNIPLAGFVGPSPSPPVWLSVLPEKRGVVVFGAALPPTAGAAAQCVVDIGSGYTFHAFNRDHTIHRGVGAGDRLAVCHFQVMGQEAPLSHHRLYANHPRSQLVSNPA